MTGARRHITLILVRGIVIGIRLGFVVSGGALGRLLPRSRESPLTGKSRTRPERRPDPNVVTLDADQVQHSKIAPVQLREFRDERTAVGHIAFNDDRTTSIFAPFQGRVVGRIANLGDVLHQGSPLLVIDSPDLVQANGDLIAASVVVRTAQNQFRALGAGWWGRPGWKAVDPTFTGLRALTVSASAGRGGSRRAGKGGVALRYLLAFIALYALPGCARDVLVLNPRTGETTTCRAGALNPWSQQEACVGDHLAHGWRKLE